MFRVKFDERPILRDITNQQKQHVFAFDLAKNRTIEERQQLIQDHISTNLTIRQASARTQFRRAVRFAREDRADTRRGQPNATLRIIGGGVAARTDLFKRFGALILRQDDGGSASSSALYRTQRNELAVGGFTIPAPGLRSATKGVARSLYPAAIGLTTRRAIAGGNEFANQYKGGAKKRGGFRKNTRFYFVKENVGIFVRQQLGKRSEYDAVWFFRTRITLPKRLDLAGTFNRGLEEQLRANYVGFYDFAMRTAR
jgi:hypothetical protein